MNNQQFSNWCQLYSSDKYAVDNMPLLMGILNITPDSFFDGGNYLHIDAAIIQAKKMLEDGVDIIDIGGVSTRPGAVCISIDEELSRVMPVIEKIRTFSDVCISIDTTKAEVMREAVMAGANVVNDINSLQAPHAMQTVAQLNVPVCLMHMKGIPETMQDNVFYQNDIIEEVNDFFKARITACLKAGIAREKIVLDPGFGFGKSVEHNLKLTALLQRFKQHQLPVMLGASRKSTVGAVLDKPVNERMMGGVVVHVLAYMNGADIIRTHDVAETRQAMKMAQAIKQAANK